MRLTRERLSSAGSTWPGASVTPAASGGRGRRPFDAGQRPVRVESDEAPADREGRGRDDLPLLAQGELGGPAADIDVEEHLVLGPREPDRARAVGGHDGFEVVPGRGADEFAALLGEQVGDGPAR